MLKKASPILVIMLSIFMSITIPSTCYGNPAEPPSILIIVPNPPADLEISIDTGNTYIKANEVDKVIEKYYTFYSRELRILMTMF